MLLQEAMIKLGLAILLGGLIGFERERRHRPAGFRTIMLVCLGATLISSIALNYINSSTQMLAAVVTGIGFLGAGAIINSQGNVKGLTTAASVWMIACVGVAIGLGYFFDAILVAVVCYLILELGGYLEHRIHIKE